MNADQTDIRSVVLYHFASCTFSLKVRIYMFFKGIKLPKRDIMLDKQARKDLVEGGGKQQVPCLQITHNNGQVDWLYESSDIIRFLKGYHSG